MPTPRPDRATLAVGQSIVSDGFRISLIGREDPVQTSTRADAGYRFVGYQFGIENVSGSRRDFYGDSDFKFIDADRYEYDSSYAFTTVPELTQCPFALSPGGKCEGWAFIEIRAAAVIVEIRFEGDAAKPGSFLAQP